MLRVRMDEKTLEKLDKCAAAMETSRSHAVRVAINRLEEYVETVWSQEK
ncbi:ribbon-helix-helix protein, CopG family [uncultured Oscillibacter sp.]